MAELIAYVIGIETGVTEMAARVVMVDEVYYVAFEQTGDFVFRIRCRSYDHALAVVIAFNL